MKRVLRVRAKFTFIALALLLLVLLASPQGAPPVIAQSGGAYFESVRLAPNPDASSSAPSATSFDLTWNTIDGGGATFSTGGVYSLGGTIGQADAGTMSGGSYSLSGGFWVDFLGNRIMLPFIVR